MKTCHSCRIALLFVLALAFSSCRSQPTPVQPVQAPEEVKAVEEVKAAEEAQAETSQEEVIRIGHMGTSTNAYIYVAVEKGFFAEQGLKVELEQFKSGSEMIAPLGLGQLDVGSGEAGTALMNAIHQGLDVRVVMSTGFLADGHNYLNLVVRKDLIESGEVKGVADLKGKKVAINVPRGQVEFMLSQTLEKNGLKLEDVETVALPFPEMAQALANDAIDAAMIQYPAAAAVLNPGEDGEAPIAELLVTGDQLSDRPYGGVLFMGKRLLDPQNHDLAVKVATAYLKSFRLLRDESWRDDPEVLEAVAKYTKLPTEAVKKSILPAYDPNAAVSPDTIATMQEYLVSRGYTEYTQVLPVDQFMQPDILEGAVQALGELK